MKKNFLFLLLMAISLVSLSQTDKHYLCFDGEENPNLKLSVYYEDYKPIYLKYKGQDEAIYLKFVSKEQEDITGRPKFITTYNEIYRGKVTGQYVFIHMGIQDYIEYTRNRDGKTFNFSINIDRSVKNDDYRKTPCY